MMRGLAGPVSLDAPHRRVGRTLALVTRPILRVGIGESDEERAGGDRLARLDGDARHARPSRGARISFCIFMASIVTSGSPAATTWSTSTRTRTTRPGRVARTSAGPPRARPARQAAASS